MKSVCTIWNGFLISYKRIEKRKKYFSGKIQGVGLYFVKILAKNHYFLRIYQYMVVFLKKIYTKINQWKIWNKKYWIHNLAKMHPFHPMWAYKCIFKAKITFYYLKFHVLLNNSFSSSFIRNWISAKCLWENSGSESSIFSYIYHR